MPAPRFVQTTRSSGPRSTAEARAEPVLMLAAHASWPRVGQWAPLDERVTQVSRLAPEWRNAGGQLCGPLDDPYLSRRPFEVRRLRDGLVELANPEAVALTVDGEPLPAGARRRVSAEELARGVALALGERALIVLTDAASFEAEDLGLVGPSRALGELRAQIRAAASGRGPFLVLGETGTGKELVARALHEQSARAGAPFVAVNVAAISPATAAAELFGHERGAFTGADKARAGYFGAAQGGTLFLDEIGDLPVELQPLLLRALESGELQPVGGVPRAADVTVVAATDAELESSLAAGRFRRPLYYRLAATSLQVPALRARAIDVAPLLAHFLCQQLSASEQDRSMDERVLVPAQLVEQLLRRAWPGNVRELRNVATALAAAVRAGRVARIEELGSSAPQESGAPQESPAPKESPAARTSAELSEETLVSALRAHRFELGRTAQALGISRSHLDALIERSSSVRKAKDLCAEEILAGRAEVGEDLDALAARLEVSPRGLRLRMRQLGL